MEESFRYLCQRVELAASIANYLSVTMALAAAGLWYATSRIETPKVIASIDFGSLGPTENPEEHKDDLDRLTSALQRQGLLNARAALAAAIAALLQGIALSLTSLASSCSHSA